VPTVVLPEELQYSAINIAIDLVQRFANQVHSETVNTLALEGETWAKSWIDENNEALGYTSVHYRIFSGANEPLLVITLEPNTLTLDGELDFEVQFARLDQATADRLLNLMETLNACATEDLGHPEQFSHEIELFTSIIRALPDLDSESVSVFVAKRSVAALVPSESIAK
jgi:hypothetical protein